MCEASCICLYTKCKNYLLCNTDECQVVLDENEGLCVYCAVMHGKLTIKENIKDKCILCLIPNKNGIEFANCTHHICVDCYKKKFIFDETTQSDKDNIFTVCAICTR